MKTTNFFSHNLKELRQKLNLSQVELGNAVGLSKQTINDIEHERSKTTLDRAIALADYFNVSLDYLVGRPFGQSRKEVTVLSSGITIAFLDDLILKLDAFEKDTKDSLIALREDIAKQNNKLDEILSYLRNSNSH